jgi:hypothetical protein
MGSGQIVANSELTAIDYFAPPLRGSKHILQLTQDCVR